MLQSIRDRSRSWGAKIIIGAVVVTMALFGVESLVGLLGNSGDDIAEVNGETITRQQLEMEVQRAIRSGQVPPEQERQLRNEMLNELIAVRLLTQYTDEGGMYLSENQLDELIVSLPEFQDQEGRFSQELFRNRLASAGYTPLSFRDQLRTDMKRQQLEQGMALSEFTLPSEREALGALQRQTRDFRYHALTVDDLETLPEADDQAIQRYYEENTEAFRRPEQVRLEYVVLDRQQMAQEVEVEEEALRERWNATSADVDRRVSHIMLTYGDERTREEAEAALQDVRERLDDGETFEDLAAEVSEDNVSAEQGGDLGVISRGFFGEAFEDAAFSLDEGQVSDIVETDNGLHLIKVTELERPDFEEVRDQLEREVALSRVSDQFNEQLQQLIDRSFAADDLQSVADEIGLTLQTSDWMSRDEADGVLSEPGVMQQAFSDDVIEEGYNSEVIELDEDRRMVLRVAEHRETSVLELDEVRDEVRSRVEARLRREALRDLATERVEQLRSGDAADIDWLSADDVGRQSSGDVSQTVIDAVFRLPTPENDESVFGHVADGDDVILIALDNVEEGEVNQEVEQFVARMAERLRVQAAIQGLLETLRDQADIERL